VWRRDAPARDSRGHFLARGCRAGQGRPGRAPAARQVSSDRAYAWATRLRRSPPQRRRSRPARRSSLPMIGSWSPRI